MSKERKRVRRRRLVDLFGSLGFGGRIGEVLDSLMLDAPPITVTRPSIGLRHLPANWDGVRIAHLTDLHHTRTADLGFLRRSVELANRESPDIIVLTGDFVSTVRGVSREMFEVLAGLRAPLGVFAVLGNHDHWSSPASIRRLLAGGGIRLIENSHVLLSRGRHRLAIAGVGDLWSDTQDLPGALGSVPESAARVLLCHNPRYAKEMPPRPRVDLMLAGHTHGMELKIPFRRRRRPQTSRRRRYAAGLIHAPNCKLYVSSGLGSTGIPFRFNGRPELPIITLRKSG